MISAISCRKQRSLLGKDDCLRLKNALVNLGNTRNWETLTKRATAGKLDGVNVLLRAGQRRVAGESGDHLNRALCDTRNLTGCAGAEQPGSRRFFIASDEGSVLLVNQPWPAVSLYDYPAHEQWGELRWLAGIMHPLPCRRYRYQPVY